MLDFASSYPYVNLYPADLEAIALTDGQFRVQTSWGTPVTGTVKKEDDRYIITAECNGKGEVADAPIDGSSAISVSVGTQFSIRAIAPPVMLREKIPYALGINRDRRMKTMEALMRKQQEINDGFFKVMQAKNPDPVYYNSFHYKNGRFNAILMADSTGRICTDSAYWFVDGYPTKQEAEDIILDLIDHCPNSRHAMWVYNMIKGE